MDNLEKREHYVLLFDFYAPVLTDKQRAYFEEYYFHDLSLAEIAVNHQVSRSAVYDTIIKTQALLSHYEEKLGCHRQYQQRLAVYEEYQADPDPRVHNIITRLKEIE